MGDIGERLRERPLVTGEVLDGVLSLAVGEVGRFHDDASAELASAFAVCVHILDTHHH
jgi:hypothetical protein